MRKIETANPEHGDIVWGKNEDASPKYRYFAMTYDAGTHRWYDTLGKNYVSPTHWEPIE